MIGVSFTLKRKYDHFLAQIFSRIDVEQFTWTISEDEILHMDNNENLKSTIFDRKIMNGLDFRQCIELDEYLLIFVAIKAFPSSEHVVTVSTFDDFMAST